MIQIATKHGFRYVGRQQPCFVIAEIGVNHNGHLDIAKRLVDVAVKTKCDAVKFQTFKQSEDPIPNISYDEHIELKKYCDGKDIIFFSTPHSLSAIDFLAKIVPVFKIASPHITNDYFVKRVKVKGIPIIASVGSMTNQNHMATIDEVNHFLSVMNNTNLALLYCVSQYPCYNFDERNFVDFRDRYEAYPVGFSSHSKDINYSLRAVELGACIVEQHITLDDDFNCPDKNVSLNPYELEKLVSCIRRIEEGNDK
jgi:sialic acid synthase SpsE